MGSPWNNSSYYSSINQITFVSPFTINSKVEMSCCFRLKANVIYIQVACNNGQGFSGLRNHVLGPPFFLNKQSQCVYCRNSVGQFIWQLYLFHSCGLSHILLYAIHSVTTFSKCFWKTSRHSLQCRHTKIVLVLYL